MITNDWGIIVPAGYESLGAYWALTYGSYPILNPRLHWDLESQSCLVFHRSRIAFTGIDSGLRVPVQA